ncbi:MAG: DUF4340 domain-containing protein [Archangium sp.]|nr:DUF4340 domain-containing protein [Archangium sp.]
MKARSTALQGTLAGVALVAAYVTWQRPKQDTAKDAVVVVDASKQSLEKIHFDDGTRFVELVRRTEAPAGMWVTQGFLEGKSPAAVDAGMRTVALDGGADAGAMLVSFTPPPPPPTREMRGSDRADNLYGRFAPLEATRALGVLPAEKLTELGFGADGERSLTVTVSGTARTFAVAKAISGVIGAYLKDAKSNEVYLLQGSLLGELDPTSQSLIDRRLHAFKQADFDRFTLSIEGKKAEFVSSNAEIPQTAKVARAATPDKPDELVKNWHDKVWNRLVVTEVLGRGEAPRAGEPTVQLRLDYTSRGSEKGWLEWGQDAKGGTWARTENTAGWVGVHQGSDELVIEAKKIAAGP